MIDTKDALTVTSEPPELSPIVRKMDIFQATEILKSLASVSEESITPDNLHPMPFSQEQTNEALLIYTKHLISDVPRDKHGNRIKYKPLKGGSSLILEVASDKSDRPDLIYFCLNTDGPLIIFNYSDPKQDDPSDKFIRFRDQRGVNRQVTQLDLEKGNNLDDYKFVWRGLRWMVINFLHWGEDGVVMPEDLDKPQIPAEIV